MDTEKFQSLINQIFTQHGFSLTNSQVSLFTIYWENLKLWNSKINLTSIRDDHEIIMKHFLDSVAVLNYFVVQENDLVVDVGSGAGFPGIPIKILRPNLDLTLVESVSKKARFLKVLRSGLQPQILRPTENVKNLEVFECVFCWLGAVFIFFTTSTVTGFISS